MNIVTDSIFSIMHLRNPKDLTLQKQAKFDSFHKQEVAQAMEKGIEAEIHEAIGMLTQYNGLVEHDNVNCKSIPTSATMAQRLKCFNR